jgi:hypothetical protein
MRRSAAPTSLTSCAANSRARSPGVGGLGNRPGRQSTPCRVGSATSRCPQHPRRRHPNPAAHRGRRSRLTIAEPVPKSSIEKPTPSCLRLPAAPPRRGRSPTAHCGWSASAEPERYKSTMSDQASFVYGPAGKSCSRMGQLSLTTVSDRCVPSQDQA